MQIKIHEANTQVTNDKDKELLDMLKEEYKSMEDVDRDKP